MNNRKLIKSRANTVVYKNKRSIEIIFYNEEFSVEGNKSKNIDRGRKFCYDNENRLRVKPGKKATWKKFFASREKSRKRALQIFYDYGKNNDWDYFFTITFDPNKHDSVNQQIVRELWKLFRQRLQYRFPQIKILVVVEYHLDNKKLHMHGIIGNVDLSSVIVKAISNRPYKKDKNNNLILDNKGNPIPNPNYLQYITGDYNEQAYNFAPSIYDFGLTTVYELKDRTQDNSVHERITHYVGKYMAKDKSAVPFNGKSYFATRNLDKGNKIMCMNTDIEVQSLIKDYGDKIHHKKKTAVSEIFHIDLSNKK